ncbi:MAG TPA: UDP-glucose/GDP-mannose dehydrogenase family protein [Pirellulales bacterium]|nr:UDP-glucose/GDP-mannose dehydrogenase family protein [Pirellulales bacterium]
MKVTVVGAGYVGLVTGVSLANLGHDVICVDVNSERVARINRGEPPIHEPGLAEMLERVIGQKRFSATTSLSDAMRGSELSMIAVGTPARAEGIDLSYVREAARQLGGLLSVAAPYHVVVVKSTVVPGTTSTLVGREVEAASGKKLGEFGLCMNPEFLCEGTAVADFTNSDRIVIGQSDAKAGRVVAELYASFTCPVVTTSVRNAEMIKYTSNTLLATMISFSNEIAGLCENVPDCDIDAVMDALHLDRRLSPMVDGKRVRPGILSYLRAGSGYGGSCLPKDIYALRMFAREQQVSTPLLDAVSQVNACRPSAVVARVEKKVGRLKGKTIALLGLAFKPGTDDMRCSPAFDVLACLREAGAKVQAYDPMAKPSDIAAHGEGVTLGREPAEVLARANAAVITTAWPEIPTWDWPSLAKTMAQPHVIDARNAFRRVSWPAPVQYTPVGVSAV